MIITQSEAIPREIRAEMTRRDVSQWELAHRLGWRPQKLSRRLTQRVDMTIGELEQITQALGADVRIELTFPSGRGVR